MKEQTENKSCDSETITYENIRKITIQKPIVKRDRRGGLHKLKEIIYFLREHGHTESQLIPYDDIEFAIAEITQGIDQRTFKKYFKQLLKFAYLKGVGHRISNNTRVIVRHGEKVFPKNYSSIKGFANYVFGLMAPKRHVETMLNVDSVPPVPPLPNEDERVSDMLERVGVTSEKCVRVSGEDRDKSREAEENVSIREKEEEDTVAHTYRDPVKVFDNSTSPNIDKSESIRLKRGSS